MANMKRYRVLRVDFDARANILSIEVPVTWEIQIQEMWHRNKQLVRQELLVQYGPAAHEQKLKNFVDLGASPFSVVSFHNTFFRQARDAFVIGAYYPSLTGICALGERILNHLILSFRDDFQGTQEYKRVYRKDSFDNWDLAIDTLEAWQIILPSTVALFRKLRDVRNRSVHFNPDTERGARAAAHAALRLFGSIIDEQFTASGNRPWYIPNDLGITFVRKAYEQDPFVARVLLPNCAHVGPGHQVEKGEDGHWIAVDPTDYPERDVGDDEFIELFKQYQRPSPIKDDPNSGGT